MIRSRSPVVARLISGLLVALVSLSVSASPFSNLFVFGDSLSDAGNVSIAVGGLSEPTPFLPGSSLVPGLPYAEGGGRFSNGPVWVEQLAASLGLSAAPALAGGTNFAFGGARTGAGGTPPGLTDQLSIFLGTTGGLAPSDALYTVWGGANDVRDAIALSATDPLGAGAIVSAAVGNIAALVGDLATAGAVTILVPNLPDLGLTPALTRLGPAAAGAGSFFSGVFNTSLAGALAPFISNPLLNVISLDIFSLLNETVANPGVFGLTNVSDPCVDIGSICTSPDDFLFWDGIHPTTVGHSLIAQLALSKVPEPATLMLLIAGLAFMAIARRRSL